MSVNFKGLKTKLLANKVILVISLVILIVALVPSLYFYNQYQKTQSLLQSSNKQVEVEAKVLIAQVGKLMELPTDENPTVATVSDKTKLLDQPFFKNAQNGDRVLVYSKAKKAILYRPSINKIVEVSMINIGNTQSPTAAVITVPVSITPSVISPTTVIEKILKVAIYNGTLTAGFASSTQKQLEAKTSKFQVMSKGDASQSDYTKTLVIDLTGKNKSAAEELAGLVNGKVGALPSGEKSPSNVDFLVILGSSK